MQLAKLDERVDLIESVGVLHHLAQPLAGWQVLADLLKPGGLMRIGLYSTRARMGLGAVREYKKAPRVLAEHGGLFISGHAATAKHHGVLNWQVA